MTDEALRRLERAAQAGDAEAAVQLLRARIRAGALSTERVALAAHVGDPIARAVLGDAPELVRWELGETLTDWLEPLRQSGPGVWARTQIALLQNLRSTLRSSVFESAWPVLEAVEAWLSEPAEVGRSEVRARLSTLDLPLTGRGSALEAATAELAATVEPDWSPDGEVLRTGLTESAARAAQRRFEASGAVAVLVPDSGQPTYALRLDRCGPSFIVCIKEIRTLTGEGLREAKDRGDRVRSRWAILSLLPEGLEADPVRAWIREALVPFLLTPSSVP